MSTRHQQTLGALEIAFLHLLINHSKNSLEPINLVAEVLPALVEMEFPEFVVNAPKGSVEELKKQKEKLYEVSRTVKARLNQEGFLDIEMTVRIWITTGTKVPLKQRQKMKGHVKFDKDGRVKSCVGLGINYDQKYNFGTVMKHKMEQ